MHQLSCGVNEAVIVDGYRVEVVELTADTVTIGLSTADSGRRIHVIQLPAAGAPRAAESLQNVSSRPAG